MVIMTSMETTSPIRVRIVRLLIDMTASLFKSGVLKTDFTRQLLKSDKRITTCISGAYFVCLA